MPGVFLSHSSKDKAFVYRLAADLVTRGIPVWFDSWELETGDSLFDRIFTGIDSGSFLVLVLSPNAVESKWVKRELNAALAKEDRLGKKVILPIRIAECEVPLAIADRLYADFSGSYLTALERLEEQLRRAGATELGVPVSRELISLRFSRLLYLEQVHLQERLGQLVPRITEDERISGKQIMVVPDGLYTSLRGILIDVVENMANEAHYSPDLEEEFQRTYNSVRLGEKALTEGAAEIANGLVLVLRDWAYFAFATHWFARLVRNEIVARMELARQYRSRDDLKPPATPISGVLGQAERAAEFFEVEKVIACDIFRRSSSDYVRVWVDAESEVGNWFRDNPQFPDTLWGFWDPTLLYKFIVPQMVSRHFWLNPSTPLAWDLTKWMIGRS